MLAAEVVFFSLPILISGVMHHFVVVRYDLLSFLKKPVDLGLAWRGKRILGNSKTFRGFIVLTVLSGSLMAVMSWFMNVPLKYNPYLCGGLLGFGYSLLELPNSFLKRRMGIGESSCAEEGCKPFFYILDQTDSIVGALLFLPVIYSPSRELIISLFFLGVFLHAALDICLHNFGYKRKTAGAIPSQ